MFICSNIYNYVHIKCSLSLHLVRAEGLLVSITCHLQAPGTRFFQLSLRFCILSSRILIMLVAIPG